MRSRSLRVTLAAAVFCIALPNPRSAFAAPGPGIGNLDCGDAEYFKPFTFIENTGSGPNGTNVALMIGGYFMTIFAPDSGAPPGEIGIYDVSNPKAAREVRHVENTDTNAFREAHSLPVGLIDGKYYIGIQTIAGIQFWDFTDPLTAARIGKIDLPGVQGGDYENVAWQATWQGKYLYVAGGNRGIYVVDASDPRNPALLKQVPTSVTGGFRVGPVFAIGDHLVISNMDQDGAYAVLDISVPDDPALLSQIRNLPRTYTISVGANERIYAAGRAGDFLTHSFTDPTTIRLVKNAPIGEDQLYVAAQDEFVFLGRQNNFVKVDVTDEQNPRVLGQGDLGRDHPDHGQVTPLGNLIFIGNDHGTGSAFFCHQRGRDTKPPVAQSIYPKDGSTHVLTAARVNVIFSDFVDMDTITQDNVTVRLAGGEPLDGIYTYNFNTLSFGPSASLQADTTYEVVLAAGGVKDVMGNALAEQVLVRFSTGASIVVPPDPDPPAGGAAGMGGTGASSGGNGGALSAGAGGASVAGAGGFPAGAAGASAAGASGIGGTSSRGGSGGASGGSAGASAGFAGTGSTGGRGGSSGAGSGLAGTSSPGSGGASGGVPSAAGGTACPGGCADDEGCACGVVGRSSSSGGNFGLLAFGLLLGLFGVRRSASRT